MCHFRRCCAHHAAVTQQQSVTDENLFNSCSYCGIHETFIESVRCDLREKLLPVPSWFHLQFCSSRSELLVWSSTCLINRLQLFDKAVRKTFLPFLFNTVCVFDCQASPRKWSTRLERQRRGGCWEIFRNYWGRERSSTSRTRWEPHWWDVNQPPFKTSWQRVEV